MGVIVTRRAIVLILTAVLLASSVPASGALTKWRTFGSGWASAKTPAYTVQPGGSIDLQVTSTTNLDPQQLRFTIQSKKNDGMVYSVAWETWCWTETDSFVGMSASGQLNDITILPLKQTVTGIDPALFDRCELNVTINQENLALGHMKLKLQVKYAD
jgi:hypothetical protein